MKVPFQLKVKSGKSVTVEQAEVRHYRTAKRLEGKYLQNTNEKGGATFVSYFIKNRSAEGKISESGRIYTGIAICSCSDNFGKRYGRRLAELRAISNYRVRNGETPFDDITIDTIADFEKDIKIAKSKIKRIKPSEHNAKKIEALETEIEIKENHIDDLWGI